MSNQNVTNGADRAREAMERVVVIRTVGVPPARFALELKPRQDSVTVVNDLHVILPHFNITVTPLSSLEPGILVVELPQYGLRTDDVAPVFAASYALMDALDVAAAEPDLPTDFFPESPLLPSDEISTGESLGGGLGRCWVPREAHLDDRPGWALETIRAKQAWHVSEEQGRPSKGRGIIIAQPDTGITEHAELRGVNSVSGFDFLGDDHDPSDPLTGDNPGHGTATASVAVSPPMLRITGSAPDAVHMPLRAIESVVSITQVTVARSINWAVEHGADVITMSLGGIPSFSLHKAIRRAVEADVIVLAAAGNCVKAVVWPARYDECLAVAGTNATDGQWPGSCLGAAVDIAAPAQNVFHADVLKGIGVGSDHVDQGQGTSYAVALTAGVAALWLAHHGRANLVMEARARGETLQTMFRRLLQSTSRQPQGWKSNTMGPGIVDAEALLRADLDLGRNLVNVHQMPSLADSEMSSVASLIAETVGFNAVNSPGMDWHRFGAELATAILTRSVTSARMQTAGLAHPPVAEHLETAVTNERLRAWLGLPMMQSQPLGERENR